LIILCFYQNLFGQDIKKRDQIRIYRDFDFEVLPNPKFSGDFVASKGVIPDMGWGKFKSWVRLNPESLKGKKFLLIQNPIFEDIKIYSDSIERGIITPGILLQNREVPFRFPTFDISDFINRPIFISGVARLNPAKFPVRLFSESEISKFKESEALRNGLFLGITAILVLLNLIIFFVFRLRAFGVFALSVSLFAALYLFLEGYFYGKSFSNTLFESPYFNLHYLIYFGFQLSNIWVFSSVFQLQIRKTGLLFVVFRVLFLIGIIEGFILLFSPLWYDWVSNFGVVSIGISLRIGAALMNATMFLILLKIRKLTPLALWFLIAIIPGWLSYLLPRFMPFLFNDFWFTMPQLYSVSMVWYTSVISLGLANMVFESLKNEVVPVHKPETKAIKYNNVLSKREMDILLAFTNGFSYTEISDAMFISPHTVRTHLKNIYAKIGVNSKVEAVRWVLNEGKF